MDHPPPSYSDVIFPSAPPCSPSPSLSIVPPETPPTPETPPMDPHIKSALERYFQRKSRNKQKSLHKMVITGTESMPAYSYHLVYLMERRVVTLCHEPYRNQRLDGEDEGSKPNKWDVQAEVPASSGKSVTLQIPHSESVTQCPECSGEGTIPCATCDGNYHQTKRCVHCFGAGKVENVQVHGVRCRPCLASGEIREIKRCANCFGSGKVENIEGRSLRCRPCLASGEIEITRRCANCSGHGRVDHVERLRVPCRPCLAYGETEETCTACRGGLVKCPKCTGHKSLKYWESLQVTWKAQANTYYTKVADLPEKKLKKGVATLVERSETLREDKGPLREEPLRVQGVFEVNIISGCKVGEMLREQSIDTRILKYRQALRRVPVQKVSYTWKEEEVGYFFIYGEEDGVFFPERFRYRKKLGCEIA